MMFLEKFKDTEKTSKPARIILIVLFDLLLFALFLLIQ